MKDGGFNKLGPVLTLAFLALAFVPAYGQTYADMNRAICAIFGAQFAGATDNDVLRKNPFEPEKVCRCSEAAARRDSRIGVLAALSSDSFQERIRDSAVNSFMMTRMMQAYFRCVTDTLDVALTNFDVPGIPRPQDASRRNAGNSK